MSTGNLALIVFLVILAQLVTFALVGLHRRRKQYRELQSHAFAPQDGPAVAAAAAAAAQSSAGSAWDGFRDFVVQRRVVEDGNRSVCSFYLTPADGHPLPAFRPGQYLTFRLHIPTPGSDQPKTLVRCYSLSDRPSPDTYRVTIKRVGAPADHPDAPPGLSSNYFHDHVEEGTRLSVRAPSGHFYLREDEQLPAVLVAGGIGITPMLSMLHSILDSGSRREVWLYYGVRNGAEQVMKGYLEELQKAHPNFHLHVCYSRPGEADVHGVDYQHQGHVDIHLLRSTLKLARYQFYVCGPKPMMETLVPALEEWGVAPGDIHYESFGPASLAKREVPQTTVGKIIQVRFSKSGKVVPWAGNAGSLLELAEANGIAVESGCRAGSCGCCQTRLEAGEVEYSQQPDADLQAGHCLLCITTPKNDLTLAA